MSSRPSSALATPASVASAASERTLARLEGDTACLVDDVVRGVVDDLPSSSRLTGLVSSSSFSSGP
jgi:hypothetical protein